MREQFPQPAAKPGRGVLGSGLDGKFGLFINVSFKGLKEKNPKIQSLIPLIVNLSLAFSCLLPSPYRCRCQCYLFFLKFFLVVPSPFLVTAICVVVCSDFSWVFSYFFFFFCGQY